MQEVAPKAQDMTHKQYRYKNRVDEIRTSQKPHQVSGALESGACVWSDEAEVRVCESALSRTEEERQPTVRRLRTGKPVPGTQEAVVRRGVVSFIDARLPERGSRTAQRSNGNQSIDLNLPFKAVPLERQEVVQKVC